MSLFNLAFVVNAMASDTIKHYSLSRPAVGSDGRQVGYPDPLSFTTIAANIQPVSDKYVKELYGFASDMTMLYVYTAAVCKNGDMFNIPNHGFFEVVAKDNWNTTGAHDRYLCKLSAPGEFKPK